MNAIHRVTVTFATVTLVAALAFAAPAFARELTPLERQVRHEIVMLPFLTVFDNIQFKVEGDVVTLLGQVTRPSLKKSAERVVERIEEVGKIDNQIEILPVSPNDDRIRQAVARAIYYHPTFTRYSFQAVPPILLIVKNGDVTLEGVVATKSEKSIAGLQANGVAGVFSVTNNLRVEGR